jgi:branched-chain amino acid transport system ATP-binding protein
MASGGVPILELRDVSVRFGGNVAVDRVSFEVPASGITGLIGPNGAGKTTTFNVITGLQPPSGGSVVFEGRDISSRKAHRRARMGIARTFQRLEIFGTLSVFDNVLFAAEVSQGWLRNRAACEQIAREVIERLGLADVAEQRADSLSTGMARLVELARALATKPRLLLLDEPASGLDQSETETFAGLLGELAASGVAILLVEHDVPLVMKVCDRVHVLDFGRVLASGTPQEVQQDQKVLDAYLGAVAEVHE